MNVRSLLISAKPSFPLAPVPAGVEIVDEPESVMHLLPADTADIVGEGDLVRAGQPLCQQPLVGAFASIGGRVKQVIPWDGGPRGRFIGVTIERTVSDGDGAPALVDPVKEPATLSADELRVRCSTFGVTFPEGNDPLLFTALDEDVDRVANRWYLEKEFEHIVTGLKVIKKMYPDNQLIIALPQNIDRVKKEACAAFGSVALIPERYPDVISRLIVNRHPVTSKIKRAIIVDSKRMVSLVSSLTTGKPQTTILVSVRIGKKSSVRLCRIPVGMRVEQLLAICRVNVSEGMQIILGGEMGGVAAAGIDQPFMPGDGALLVSTDRELTKSENASCVNCGRCYRCCPVGLRVDLIGKYVEYSKREEAARLGVDHCIDCGLCTAVCIVRRPLAYLCAFGKEQCTGNALTGAGK